MKKLFALLLALVMVLSLAACGGGEEPKETKAPATTGGNEDPILSQEDLEDIDGALDALEALMPEGPVKLWSVLSFQKILRKLKMGPSQIALN